MKKSRSRDDTGFTLIEIAVSVAILGVALTTLVGLNTRMLDTYFSERNRVRASLYAQYILTMMETSPEPPEPGTKDEPLRAYLDELGFFDEDDLKAEKQPPKSWTYRKEVTSVALAELDDALRRIDLSISWGKSEDDTFTMVFFMPTIVDDTSNNPFAGLNQPTSNGAQSNTPNSSTPQ